MVRTPRSVSRVALGGVGSVRAGGAGADPIGGLGAAPPTIDERLLSGERAQQIVHDVRIRMPDVIATPLDGPICLACTETMGPPQRVSRTIVVRDIYTLHSPIVSYLAICHCHKQVTIVQLGLSIEFAEGILKHMTVFGKETP